MAVTQAGACLWDEGRVEAGPLTPAPSEADVVIVGAGFTGLWTAYHLLAARPGLAVAVLEAHAVGFGASGRNGGWVSALWPVAAPRLAAEHSREAALSQFAALRETVRDIGAICTDEGIDAGFAQGGTVSVARGPGQASRGRAEVAEAAAWGQDLEWLSADEAASRVAIDGIGGATYSPHCARIHPGRLVDGLAAAVRRAGGLIVERTPVRAIESGGVELADGRRIAAGAVVRATEAWTSTFDDSHRAVVPVYSLIVATEPLSETVWDQIGLRERETFTDLGYVTVYGQRSIDDRLVFGGRGAPYHFGSRIRPEYDTDERVFASLRSTLRSMFPVLADTDFTHAWGGPLGVTRDWHPSVTFDPTSRVGTAGGYVGDGVAASALAGATLAALILGTEDPRTSLPWVNHVGRAWEVEPLRWLGINAGLRLASVTDAEEARTGKPSRLGKLLDRLTAH